MAPAPKSPDRVGRPPSFDEADSYDGPDHEEESASQYEFASVTSSITRDTKVQYGNEEDGTLGDVEGGVPVYDDAETEADKDKSYAAPETALHRPAPPKVGSKRKVLMGITVLLVALIVTVVSLFLTGNLGSSTDNGPKGPVEIELDRIMTDISGTTIAVGTPQKMAYDFILRRDPVSLDSYMDEAKIQQRYGLVTLFYATGGDTWTDNSGWLSRDECGTIGVFDQFWMGVSCNELGRVRAVAFGTFLHDTAIFIVCFTLYLARH
jgi:hypothetical protein